MGVGVFTITAQRRKAVDFTYSFWEEPMSYVMRTNPTATIDKIFRPITVSGGFDISIMLGIEAIKTQMAPSTIRMFLVLRDFPENGSFFFILSWI